MEGEIVIKGEGFVVRWDGGPYAEVFADEKGQTPYTVVNLWDYEVDRPRIAYTVDALEKEIAYLEEEEDWDAEAPEELCVVCANTSSYCQGHGEIGDPEGFETLRLHDSGEHADCHPKACPEADR